MADHGSEKGGEVPDLENQASATVVAHQAGDEAVLRNSGGEDVQGHLTIVIPDGDAMVVHELAGKASVAVDLGKEAGIVSPKKGYLSRSDSSNEQCRYLNFTLTVIVIFV